MNNLHGKEQVKKKRQVLSEKIKKEVAYYAWKNGIADARKWASRKYPNYTFIRETLRDWKLKYQEHFANKDGGESSVFALPRDHR